MDNPPDEKVIAKLAEQAHALSTRLSGAVKRLYLGAGDYKVEIEWEPGAAPAHVAPLHAVASEAMPAVEVEGRHAIVAPLVGTFYRAAEPGAKPFVEVGDFVEADQPVAIVEAMKIMNRIVADRAGRIAEIMIGDGEMVEFEQPLIYLEPAEAAAS